jgi:hypothetical protein
MLRINSSDEDDEKMKPDELTGMYTAEMNPKEGPKVLTAAEVAFQRAATGANEDQASLAQTPARSLSPIGPDGDDWSWMNPQQLRLATAAVNAIAEGKTKTPSRPVSPTSEPVIQAPAKAAPLEIKTVSKSKAAAPPRAPADQPTGAKAPPPTKRQVKGQESPEAKASHPMQTRKPPSGAGGLRSGGGSGQTDTCVAQGNPSKT